MAWAFISATFKTAGKDTLTINAHGLGTGIFAQSSDSPLEIGPTFAIPLAEVVGDFNGDGKLDLAVACSSGVSLTANTLDIMLGNGNGTFATGATYSVGPDPRSIATGDFTGDGKLDLAIVNDYNVVSILLGNGNGTFGPAVNYNFGPNTNVEQVVSADFNGDGKLDLGVTYNGPSNTGSVGVLLGNGNGTFATPTFYAVGPSPTAICVGDFNNDGKLDLAVLDNSNATVSILLGNGDGTFGPCANYSTAATSKNPTGMAVGDFTGNGNLDLAIGDSTGANVDLLLGLGNGAFVGSVVNGDNTASSGVAAADFTGNGKLDLVMTGGIESGQISEFLGTGTGLFNTPQTFVVGTTPNGIAMGDFNGDGAPDLVVLGTFNELSGDASVLLDQTGAITTTLSDYVGSGPASHFAVAIPTYDLAGAPLVATVTALDQFNNVVTSYNGVIQLTSSDGKAGLPAILTLSGGVGTFTVTFRTAGTQSLVATDTVTSSITGSASAITVVAGAANHLAVGALAATTAGNPIVVTVTALDAFNNIVLGDTDTIHFTSNDAQAALPPDAPLQAGVGFFAAILKTAGNDTITATDTAAGNVTGTSQSIAVTAAAASHFSVTAPATAITGDPVSFTVTALDQFANLVNAYNRTVHFASSDGSAILPAAVTLSNGVGTFSATLFTPGNQTITVNDTVATKIAGTSNTITTRGLTVASLVPTTSGFIATFSKPFIPSEINLYDQGGLLGSDDVLLTGPGSANILPRFADHRPERSDNHLCKNEQLHRPCVQSPDWRAGAGHLYRHLPQRH